MQDKSTPYEGLGNQLILRDRLAADRTILSNERTFLAYIRTALTLFIAGLSFVHFEILGSSIIDGTICAIFVVLSIATFLVGLVRYKRMQVRTREIKREELKQLKKGTS